MGGAADSPQVGVGGALWVCWCEKLGALCVGSNCPLGDSGAEMLGGQMGAGSGRSWGAGFGCVAGWSGSWGTSAGFSSRSNERGGRASGERTGSSGVVRSWVTRSKSVVSGNWEGSSWRNGNSGEKVNRGSSGVIFAGTRTRSSGRDRDDLIGSVGVVRNLCSLGKGVPCVLGHEKVAVLKAEVGISCQELSGRRAEGGLIRQMIENEIVRSGWDRMVKLGHEIRFSWAV